MIINLSHTYYVICLQYKNQQVYRKADKLLQCCDEFINAK